jgi:hypothetical protein
MPKLVVLPPALIEAVGASLTKKSVPTCRIKWKGEYVQVENGKSVWRTRGHARAAFRHHLGAARLTETIVREMGIPRYGQEYRTMEKAVIDSLEACGLLKFETGV